MACCFPRSFLLALATIWLLPTIAFAQAKQQRNFLNKKVVQLPIQINEEARGLIEEIRLYAKDDLAAKWALRETAGATNKAFTFEAPADGEYWFTMVTVDKQGRTFPRELTNEPPGLAVVIDTQPPTVELTNLGATAEGQLVQCDVADANLDLSGTRVSYQGDDKEFHALESTPGRNNVYRIPAKKAFTGLVRVSARDLAGNEAVREEHISKIKGPMSDTTAQAPKETPQESTGDRPPAAKVPTKKDMDGMIATAFGKDSAEMRRPIRVWLPDIKTILAAEKATIAPDGLSVRFAVATVCLAESEGDIKTFRGEEIVVFADDAIERLADLSNRGVTFEIRNKSLVVVVAPETSVVEEKIKVVGPDDKRIEKIVKKLVVVKGRGVIQFKFTIDPKTPLGDLLPTPLKTTAKLPPWTNEDLAKVPELAFGQPISKALPKQNAVEQTAHRLAKINHLNRAKTDGFMLAMIEQRGDLRGLPFLMGDECRTREERARMFAKVADSVNQAVSKTKAKEEKDGVGESLDKFWAEVIGDFQGINTFDSKASQTLRLSAAQSDHANRAVVAALTQILMPESEHYRLGMAKFLATIPHIDATKALAKLVLFSPEDEVRAAAIEGLKLRREKDYADVLMQGFTYPLPAVSKRAAEALVKLERKDLLENLVQVLESPDPRLPVTRTQDGKEVAVVRELVKVNHHRNCLLCHAPGNTDSTPGGVLKVAVPLPGEPLPKPSEGGGYQSTPPATPDIVVRIDMTYLRQDFSLMMPVSDAHPWPDMQRFDFLVRTRTLTAAEAKAYEPENEPGRLSPYHRAALFALRELTGRDTEPTAVAWRKLLKLPKTAS